MQLIYIKNGFVNRYEDGRTTSNLHLAIGKDGMPADVGMDIFERCLYLPSDNKMTPEQQDVVIDIIRACFE